MTKQPRNNHSSSGATAKAAPPRSNRSKTAAPRKTAKKVAADDAPAKRKAPLASASQGAGAKSSKSAAAPAASGALAEGDRAPSFSLPRDRGGTIGLADFAGRQLVVFFYPRAGTSGCTREAVDFTRLAAEFERANTALLGVSADPPAAQDKFRDKYQLTMPLGSDERHAMLQAYGAWGEKSLYGKKFEGIIRTTVLIGTDGRVKRLWRKVKVDGHAEAVLAAAKMQS